MRNRSTQGIRNEEKKRTIQLTKHTTMLAKRRVVLPCLSSTRTKRTSSARAEVANSFAAASVFRLDTPTPKDARRDGQKKRGKNVFHCLHDRYLGRTRKKVTTYCAGTYFLRQLLITSAVQPSRSSVFALYVRTSHAIYTAAEQPPRAPCTRSVSTHPRACTGTPEHAVIQLSTKFEAVFTMPTCAYSTPTEC